MALVDKTQTGIAVSASFASLPSRSPELPEDVLKRFPSLVDWSEQMARLHARVREAVDSVNEDLSLPISNLETATRNLAATADGLSASITEEREARIDGDAAIATDLTTLESSFNDYSASVDIVLDTYADNFGYLAGSYVLKVGAGDRVAGMSVTAISAPTGWASVSKVSFLADIFQIYNDDTNTDVAPFQVVDGVVRITGDLVLAYSDISGAKPPADADVTLSVIEDGLSISGGGITLDAGGAIKGGATSFASGVGFFLGYEAGKYKFRVGNPSGPRIEWDGDEWTVVDLVDIPTGAPLSAALTLTGDVKSAPNGGAQNDLWVTCIATGGTGPYTYEWIRMSGVGSVTAGTLKSTKFGNSGTNVERNDVWICRVTDSASATADSDEFAITWVFGTPP